MRKMPLVEVEIEVEVFCAKCGSSLCNQTESTEAYNRGQKCFRVDPCESCLKKAEDDGYEKGYEEGFEEGYEEGFESGRSSLK